MGNYKHPRLDEFCACCGAELKPWTRKERKAIAKVVQKLQAFIITVELAPEIMKRIPELQGEPLKTEELK